MKKYLITLLACATVYCIVCMYSVPGKSFESKPFKAISACWNDLTVSTHISYVPSAVHILSTRDIASKWNKEKTTSVVPMMIGDGDWNLVASYAGGFNTQTRTVSDYLWGIIIMILIPVFVTTFLMALVKGFNDPVEYRAWQDFADEYKEKHGSDIPPTLLKWMKDNYDVPSKPEPDSSVYPSYYMMTTMNMMSNNH